MHPIKSALIASVKSIVAVAALQCGLGQPATAQETANSELSGAKFKNVTALADMPADQMGKVMNIMSASLSVNCQFCHEGTDFAKEGVGHKDIGRTMIEMTLDLNKRHFEGREAVTCFTCHRGQKHPTATFMNEPKVVTTGIKQPSAKPSAESILTKFVAAIGGKEKLASLKSRHVVGRRIEPDGRVEPEEVWNTANGQYRMLTTYGSGENLVKVAEVFDGKTATKNANGSAIQLKEDERLLIEREARMGFGADLVAAFPKLEFERMASIEDRSVAVLGLKTQAGIHEQLFFDEQTAMLIRRTTAIPTVLGDFVHQIDYQDYKAFDGVSVPTKIRFSVPNILWTREVVSVEHNQQIDPAIFK